MPAPVFPGQTVAGKRQVLTHRPRFAIPLAIDYVLQSCEALAELDRALAMP